MKCVWKVVCVLVCGEDDINETYSTCAAVKTGEQNANSDISTK